MAKEKEKSASLERLAISFNQKEFAPLYLFYGEEDFLIEGAVNLLVGHAIDQSSRSFNLDILYGGDVDVRDVVSHASLFPMMAERRAVVVRDADKLVTSELSREILLRYLEHPLPSTILVFIMETVDMRLTIFKAFQERGVVVEFKQLYENQIPDWIAKRVEKFGRRITPEACQLMQAHVGKSLREIHNEIEKLFVYVGEKKVIEVGDVAAVVGMSRMYNVFELQKAIGQGNLAWSIEIVEHMLDAGELPLGIIVMLTWYFQKLWVLPSLQKQVRSEYELASALHVSPYFIKEYIAAARRFPPSHIEHAFTALLEADATLKSTQEDPKLVMTTLVYKLIKPVDEAVIH